MARSIAITLAAAATIAVGSAGNSPALAHGSHGSHGSHVSGGAVTSGQWSTHSNWVGSTAHSNWVGDRHHHNHDHHFRRFSFGPGYAFIEPYDYYYYGDCYQRVWTKHGWRWVSLCY
ncbi:MAG TPA: hypothetical protein VK430_09605 [Xanthobacteraceae bacterium]|nr:hypothetical protein [Xanthobacteraceae bacterium]